MINAANASRSSSVKIPLTLFEYTGVSMTVYIRKDTAMPYCGQCCEREIMCGDCRRHRGRFARMAEELRAIRRYLADDVALVVGGRAAVELEDVIVDLGGHRVGDMLEFQSLLDSIRGGVDE